MCYNVTTLRNKEHHMSTQIDISAPSSRIRWAGLAGRERPGGQDAPAVVLLHGLTFDRRMWDPVLAALPAGQRAIAFDLPGHGGSAMSLERGLMPVVEALHEAVVDAGITEPVMVGHSIGGPIAGIYAATYATAAVVSVEAPIRLERFAPAMTAALPQLTGDGFAEAWSWFAQGMRAELLPPERRALLAAGRRPVRDVVLGYQADLLERPLDEVVAWRDEGFARLARDRTPYLSLHADSVDEADRRWLVEMLPQAEVVVWPVKHHFPHLERPQEFAELVAATARSARRGSA
jgi:pimeloyl-ACP methyl ester carboxylesterase